MRHTKQHPSPPSSPDARPNFSHRTDYVVQRLLLGHTVNSHVPDLTVGPLRLGVWCVQDGPCRNYGSDVFDIAYQFVRAELRRVGEKEAA